jgi:hypothetical protein
MTSYVCKHTLANQCLLNCTSCCCRCRCRLHGGPVILLCAVACTLFSTWLHARHCNLKHRCCTASMHARACCFLALHLQGVFASTLTLQFIAYTSVLLSYVYISALLPAAPSSESRMLPWLMLCCSCCCYCCCCCRCYCPCRCTGTGTSSTCPHGELRRVVKASV